MALQPTQKFKVSAETTRQTNFTMFSVLLGLTLLTLCANAQDACNDDCKEVSNVLTNNLLQVRQVAKKSTTPIGEFVDDLDEIPAATELIMQLKKDDVSDEMLETAAADLKDQLDAGMIFDQEDVAVILSADGFNDRQIEDLMAYMPEVNELNDAIKTVLGKSNDTTREARLAQIESQDLEGSLQGKGRRSYRQIKWQDYCLIYLRCHIDWQAHFDRLTPEWCALYPSRKHWCEFRLEQNLKKCEPCVEWRAEEAKMAQKIGCNIGTCGIKCGKGPIFAEGYGCGTKCRAPGGCTYDPYLVGCPDGYKVSGEYGVPREDMKCCVRPGTNDGCGSALPRYHRFLAGASVGENGARYTYRNWAISNQAKKPIQRMR